jgi:hypothetical protein
VTAAVFVSGGGRRFHATTNCRALNSGRDMWDFDPPEYAPWQWPKQLREMDRFEAIVRGKDPCRTCFPEEVLPFRMAPEFGHLPEDLETDDPYCPRCTSPDGGRVVRPCWTSIALDRALPATERTDRV